MKHSSKRNLNKKNQKETKSEINKQIDLEISETNAYKEKTINYEETAPKKECLENFTENAPLNSDPSPLGQAFEKAFNENEKKNQEENSQIVKVQIKPENTKKASKASRLFKSKRLGFFVAVVVCVLCLVFAGNYVSTFDKIEGHSGGQGIKAEVTKVVRRLSAAQDLEGFQSGDGVNIIFEAKLLSGENRGKTVRSVQSWDPNATVPIKEVQIGDKVLLLKNAVSDSKYNLIFADYIRFDNLFFLILGFFALLLIFGQSKGARTILSLLLTFGAIFGVFLPSVLAGKNVYAWAIGISFYIIIMTMIVAIGFNRKSFCAGLGCIAGSVFCGFLVSFSRNALMLSGFGSDEAMFLAEISKDNPLDLNGIIFAAIIIGAVGAIMDVSMSISSSLYELKEKSPSLKARELLSSGLSIGKDIMGTMANTLILAYIGSSLTMTLLMMAYNDNLMLLLNKETLIVEILQAVAGSIAILITIPLTSIICSVVYSISKTSTIPFEEETLLLEEGKELKPFVNERGDKIVPVGAISSLENEQESKD